MRRVAGTGCACLAKGYDDEKFLAVSAALGALFISTALAAAADDYQPMAPVTGGFYASLHGGVLAPTDPSVMFQGNVLLSGTVDVDTGYRFGGSIGYDFNDNVAAEFETSYIRNGTNWISTSAVSGSAPGEGTGISLMGNVILGNHYGAWRPYVGGGIGGTRVSLDVDFMSGVDDSDWAFSAQAFAGVDYQVSDRVSIGGRYRYQHIGATDFADGNGFPVDLDPVNAHSVEFVVKYRFGG